MFKNEKLFISNEDNFYLKQLSKINKNKIMETINNEKHINN